MFRRQALRQGALARLVTGLALRSDASPRCWRALSTRVSTTSLVTPRTKYFAPRPAPAIRWHSAPADQNRVYQFPEVQEISVSPKPGRILIDVREPSEYKEGYIPSAINIPVKTQPDALFLEPEEFEERFGFEKPEIDAEVIFYCKSGVRSSAAAYLARQHGYTNVAEYKGSWLDWRARDGARALP